MKAEEFRALALALPEVEESAHMGHPDFRIKGKIFATLSPPKQHWGMVKLTPEQQDAFVRAKPDIFEPFNGAWGKRGCTKVHLAAARARVVKEALQAAWNNTAG